MGKPVTAFDRDVALSRLRSETFDVLVIGGGVTGAGVALDAAARGLKTALVERSDFASGTSSKSSKLVHGGLRYLQQREFRLVRENLTERQRLLRNAPHLVEPLTFLVPLFGKGGAVDKSIVQGYSIALWLYDLAGGLRIGKRHKKVTAEEIFSSLPGLKGDRVVAGFLYYDARTDDARLTLTIVRTAALGHGAVAVNYAPVVGYLKDEKGQVRGARVRPLRPEGGPEGTQAGADAADAADAEDGDIEIHARAVVNATGIWADELRALDSAGTSPELRPAKGIHLSVPRSKLPCDTAAILPVRADRRSIFVVPWGDYTYLGTTDTDYDGALDDPAVTPEDVAYVLDAVNAVLAEPLSPADVTGTWAGLRPLLATAPGRRQPSERTSDLSRRHRVIVDGDGLVTVTGGKLTTYRKMAEDAVGMLSELLDTPLPACPTKRLRLRGADGLAALRRPGAARELGVGRELLEHLVARYGGEAGAVLGLAEGRPELAEPIAPGLPNVGAEVVYAVRYEMAQHLEDVLARRMRWLLLDAAAALAAAPAVARLMAGELGWDGGRESEEVARFSAIVDTELRPLGGGLGARPGDAGSMTARMTSARDDGGTAVASGTA